MEIRNEKIAASVGKLLFDTFGMGDDPSYTVEWLCELAEIDYTANTMGEDEELCADALISIIGSKDAEKINHVYEIINSWFDEESYQDLFAYYYFYYNTSLIEDCKNIIYFCETNKYTDLAEKIKDYLDNLNNYNFNNTNFCIRLCHSDYFLEINTTETKTNDSSTTGDFILDKDYDYTYECSQKTREIINNKEVSIRVDALFKSKGNNLVVDFKLAREKDVNCSVSLYDYVSVLDTYIIDTNKDFNDCVKEFCTHYNMAIEIAIDIIAKNPDINKTLVFNTF